MNIMHIGEGNIVIPLGDNPIEINGRLYKGLSVIARLLTSEEVIRLLRIDQADRFIMEQTLEDVFAACVISIPGISEDVSLDYSAAGLITTVGTVIVEESMKYIDDPISEFEETLENIDLLDTMCAVISRYLNISYFEAKKTPINTLFRMYASLVKAFPSEVSPIKESDGSENGGMHSGFSEVD